MLIPLNGLLLAVAAAAEDPRKLHWYQFKGLRAVKLYDNHPQFDLDLEQNEVFGIRKKGQKMVLVTKEDPKITFTVDMKTMASIIKRSAGWEGKVGRYKVNAGTGGSKDKKPKNTLLNKEPVSEVSVNVKRARNADSPRIRAALKATKIEGLDSATFLFSEQHLPGEWYYYYDLGRMFERKAKKSILPAGWDTKLQKQLDTKTRLMTSVSPTMYKGNLIPLLVVVDLVTGG